MDVVGAPEGSVEVVLHPCFDLSKGVEALDLACVVDGEAIGAELGSSGTAVNHENALSKELSLQCGSGHGWQAVEVLCLRCTDPTLSAVHHARGAVAICDVRLLPPTFVRLLPAAARAGRLLPHGLHASACAPPSHQLAPAAPAFANA